MNSSGEFLSHKIIDLLLDTVFVVDEHGRFVDVSASCETLLGYAPAELIGCRMTDFLHPDDKERTLQAAAKVMSGSSHIHFENRYIRKDGRIAYISWSARWLVDERLRIAVARDITSLRFARRKQEVIYKISEAAFVAENLDELYAHIHQVVVDLLPSDIFLILTYENGSELLDFSYVAGIFEHTPTPQKLAANCPLAEVIQTRKPLLFTSAGEGIRQTVEFPDIGEFTECVIAPLCSQKKVMGVIVMGRTTSDDSYTSEDCDLLNFVCTQIATAIERKQAEAALHHLATHDPLTSLPNRALFHDRFQMAINRAQRDNEHVALLYIDLDNFKQINDSLGHDAGDMILCDLANRITDCVRKSDTVARIGGDEFTILLLNIVSPEHIEGLVAKIQSVVSAPFVVNAHTLHVSASIGSAIYPDHGTDLKTLFSLADSRMYKVKRRNLEHYSRQSKLS
mgnify:CR=1 FL=1